MEMTAHSPAEARLDGVHVLVVDDEPAVLRLLTRGLEHAGATVDSASSAGEALRKLVRTVPDLLLTDIRMPGEDGYRLIEQVRALPPERGGQTPAVAFTGFADANDHAFSLAAGFNAHLMKPLEPHDLVALLASLVGHADDESLCTG